MKKLFFTSIVLLISLSLTSCYTTQVYHGNVTENTPQIEVASKPNHILLWGLLPLSGCNQVAKESIGNRKNFTTKTEWTVVDALLHCITLGIYTPTTTKYYIPLDER